MFKKLFLLAYIMSLCVQPAIFCMQNDPSKKNEKEIDRLKTQVSLAAEVLRNVRDCGGCTKRPRERLRTATTKLRTLDPHALELQDTNELLDDPQVLKLQVIDEFIDSKDPQNTNHPQQPLESQLPHIGDENPQTLLDRFRLAIKDFMLQNSIKSLIGTSFFEVGLTYALIDLAATCAGCIGTTLDGTANTRNKKLLSDSLILSENIFKEIGLSVKCFEQIKGPVCFGSELPGVELPLMISINALDGITTCKELLATTQTQPSKKAHQKKAKIIRTLYALEIVMRALVVCETLYENNTYYAAKATTSTISKEYVRQTVSYNARLWQVCASMLNLARLAVKHFYHEKAQNSSPVAQSSEQPLDDSAQPAWIENLESQPAGF